ncbi:glycosyltransferase family 4 protein [uncultured Desulfosarcina sp.]|uniref:glycosyltransferase family 4 protein n=1 Tax=uncultured Desulfosarcina sp. TaxID=218289 RepID=UPI0029C75879|nr:glycosyltransferase family 4 protein [uncultured Desulfosarcina sp.]
MRTSGSNLYFAEIIGNFNQGGDGRVANHLACGLEHAGARATCISLRRGGNARNEDGPQESLDLGSRRRIVGSLIAFGRLVRFIRRARPSVLHVHGQQSLVVAALAIIGLRNRPQFWFTWHNSEGVFDAMGLRGWLMRWAVRRCDMIFGASRSIVDRMRATLGNFPRIEVFRNGVPVMEPTTGMQADEPVICWCGRIVPSKDPRAFIRAAAVLNREGLRFHAVLAGDSPAHLGWFMDETRALAAELGLADIVEFPGWVDDVAALIRRSAIGVQTSHTEGLSMTLLEQMMAGLAVVATDVGDTSIAVEDGKSGYVIPAKDDTALVDRLRRLLEDPRHRTQIGAAARQRAIAEFSLASMARQAREAYQVIAVQRKQAGEAQPPGPGQHVAGEQG